MALAVTAVQCQPQTAMQCLVTDRAVACHAVLQGQLLQGLTAPLERIMEYEDIRTTAGKLLQYVRSMPAVTSAVVGQKVGLPVCLLSAELLPALCGPLQL